MPAETVAAAQVTTDVHAWEAGGASSPEALAAWVSARLASHEAALAALLAVEGPRTVDNTLRLYDAAIEHLALAGAQAGVLNSVASDKAVRDQAQMEAQRVAMTASALSLNRGVYDALVSMDLTGASAATRHFVERTLLGYRLAGVDKDKETRDRIQALHEKATMSSLEFSRNIQEGAKTIVATQAELDGLPPDYLGRHQPDAGGQITLSTDQPDMQPVMTFATNGDLRERMFLAYNTRAYPVNGQILLNLLSTRQEIASVLGFRSWADLATADQMMGSAANVRTFLAKLEEASRDGAVREHELVVEFARGRQPGLKSIDITSRGYWYEQFRRATFDFDSQSVRPYFPYAAVEQGILETAARLFHVNFKPNPAAAVWHPQVTAWDVYDRGRLCGRFYLDMHPREGKDKWFSAAPLIPGIRGRQLPEAALICNFPGGKADDPGLMQYSDVVTFFHEFGHLMHAILGGQQQWAGVSGIATEGDFVEVPSQMLEEFFHDAGLLASFARHYQTGEPIPAELVERMNRASAFGRADGVRTQLFYTSYSLDVHNQPPENLDPDKLLEEGYKRMMPYEWVDGNRMYSSFTHLIGYSSNYYTYMFDKVIALDFFRQFDPADLLDGPTAMRYRQSILEPGGSRPGTQLIEEFLGRQQSMDAFAAWVGEEFAAPAGKGSDGVGHSA